MTDGSMFATSNLEDYGEPSIFANRSYILMFFDVNGFKKPNKMGVDIFVAQVFANKVVPAGSLIWQTPECCGDSDFNAFAAIGGGFSAKALSGEDY